MGKGGGSQHTPYEEPDNLKSRQVLSLIDLISEGPIEGPVGGLKGVFLNDTPVISASGEANFSGVNAEWRSCTQTQSYLSGFPAVENEIRVDVEIKVGKPVVRSITDPDINRVRVTVGVQALLQMEDDGDMYGTTVELSVQLQPAGGSWFEAQKVVISGKTRSTYLRSVMLESLPARPFNMRVVRLTADSSSSKLENRTLWSSYTEIIDAKLTYPNTAVVGMRLDPEQFSGGVPRRTYLMRGRLVKVPDNYDPYNRTYTGLWTGNFKVAWTNNPAWIFYDLVTCERAGLGKRLGAFGADKFALYMIGRYCDERVDDGYGNKEPRMTCNVYLADARKAYDVLSDLASVFRGMPIWDGLSLTCIQDRPADPVWMYTEANVVDGRFTYQSSARKARHTAVHVQYVSPDNGWQTQIEYVADDEAIARYGLNVLEVSAFGCTSRGQAHRTGKWILETERLERQSVSFSVGRDGLKHLPGDIIQIADSGYAGIRIGGRIKAVVGQNVQLDREVELPGIDSGATAYLTWIGADAKPIRAQIFSQPAADTVVLGNVPTGMCAGDIWTLSRDDIRPRLFRCIKITEEKTDTATQFKIEAVQHEPNKEAEVDAGAVFDPKPDTIFGGKIPPVEHLKIDAFPYGDSYQIKMRWETPRVIEGISFEVRLSRADKLHLRDTTTDPEYVCYGLPLGDYTVSIRGKNAGGQLGQETESTFTIAPPTAPTSLLLRSTNFSVTACPVVQPPTALGTQYEWFKGMSRAEVEAMSDPLGRAMIVNDQECVPDTEYWYGCRAVNGVGKSTLVIASIKTKLQPEDILDLIGPEIPKLDWAKDLSQMVEKNSSNIVLLSDRAALVVNKEGRVSGITVTAESEASAVDFLADFVSFTDPDTLQRNLYWDNRRRTLVVKGELRLLDGTAISSKNDLGNGAGGVFRLRTETGVFPSDAQTANALFTSAFNTLPGKDTVFTVYALDGNGHITRTESRMYDGREWVVPKLFMDGDLIALGTIKGDRLVAGTEIYSPVIKSGLVEAATIRSNAFPPAFELLPDGTLNARKANITGSVNATSGLFQNVVIDESCTVKRLYADKIVGDVTRAYTLGAVGHGAGSTLPAYLSINIPALPRISYISIPAFAVFGMVNYGDTQVVANYGVSINGSNFGATASGYSGCVDMGSATVLISANTPITVSISARVANTQNTSCRSMPIVILQHF